MLRVETKYGENLQVLRMLYNAQWAWNLNGKRFLTQRVAELHCGHHYNGLMKQGPLNNDIKHYYNTEVGKQFCDDRTEISSTIHRPTTCALKNLSYFSNDVF
jgi:hypothetical protein